MSESAPNHARLFATTLWTVVLQAGSQNSDIRKPALEQLCRTYWYPIYAHVRRRGHSPHDAQDLTQGFFASLLQHADFDALTPANGRFRSYLLGALGHYLSDQFDRARAAKRGGGRPLLSLDDANAEDRYRIEPAAADKPELEFDRRWALCVMATALEKLAAEQEKSGKAAAFGSLRRFLTDPTDNGEYEAVARELQTTPNTIAATVRRLRQRYREIVRAEIADTLRDPADADAEMRQLLAAMRP